jgi:hypothetical protein
MHEPIVGSIRQAVTNAPKGLATVRLAAAGRHV